MYGCFICYQRKSIRGKLFINGSRCCRLNQIKKKVVELYKANCKGIKSIVKIRPKLYTSSSLIFYILSTDLKSELIDETYLKISSILCYKCIQRFELIIQKLIYIIDALYYYLKLLRS